MEWDEYFLNMAKLVASKSKDPNTKCGCIIVGPDNEVRSCGYNGLPRNVNYTSERNERPIKYYFYEHAERNAIYNSSRVGIPLKGCRAYIIATSKTNTGNLPCCDCTRSIINVGIVEIVLEKKNKEINDIPTGTWRDGLKYSEDMLNEAGVKVRYV